MKQYLSAALMALCVLFTGCQKEKPETQTPEEKPGQEQTLESIILDVTELTLNIGEERTLTVTTEPAELEGITISWTSSDESVASVNDGTITANAAGEATVTASCGDISASCSVTVVENEVEAESISLSAASLTLIKDQTIVLTATVLPENTSDKTVSWSSSDDNIATVDQNGEVKAINIGNADITATTVNGKSAVCAVSVQAAPNVGDYFYSDGTWSSTRDEGKTVIGLVYYLGDIAADDATLADEHPGCTHGLVIALNGTKSSWQSAYETYGNTVSSWIEANTDYTPIITNEETDSFNKALGYNNTRAIEAFNADPANSNWPVEAVQSIVTFRETNSAPDNTSGWYLPSAKEMSELSPVRSSLNETIEALGGEPVEGMMGGLVPGFFYTSSEYDSANCYVFTTIGGTQPHDKNSGMTDIRPVLAF